MFHSGGLKGMGHSSSMFLLHSRLAGCKTVFLRRGNSLLLLRTNGFSLNKSKVRNEAYRSDDPETSVSQGDNFGCLLKRAYGGAHPLRRLFLALEMV